MTHQFQPAPHPDHQVQGVPLKSLPPPAEAAGHLYCHGVDTLLAGLNNHKIVLCAVYAIL